MQLQHMLGDSLDPLSLISSRSISTQFAHQDEPLMFRFVLICLYSNVKLYLFGMIVMRISKKRRVLRTKMTFYVLSNIRIKRPLVEN